MEIADQSSSSPKVKLMNELTNRLNFKTVYISSDSARTFKGWIASWQQAN